MAKNRIEDDISIVSYASNEYVLGPRHKGLFCMYSENSAMPPNIKNQPNKRAAKCSFQELFFVLEARINVIIPKIKLTIPEMDERERKSAYIVRPTSDSC
jgi:hypothetical protein